MFMYVALSITGTNVDIGAGGEFGGAEADEGCDDAAETKLDQFWQFGDIEVRVLHCEVEPAQQSRCFVLCAVRARTLFAFMYACAFVVLSVGP